MPLIALVSVKLLERLMASVPPALTVIAPPSEPVVPPLPSERVPWLTVVPPVEVLLSPMMAIVPVPVFASTSVPAPF